VHDRERHRTSEPEQRRTAPEPPKAGLDILALQRSAGNQAVGALLSRDATTEAPPPARETLTKVGVIPLESFSRSVEKPNQNDPGPQGITCVSKVGGHSGQLSSVMANGDAVDADLEQLKTGFKISLKEAHVTSYSVSNDQGVPFEQWTLLPPPTPPS
jgi:hypothetical protein